MRRRGRLQNNITSHYKTNLTLLHRPVYNKAAEEVKNPSPHISVLDLTMIFFKQHHHTLKLKFALLIISFSCIFSIHALNIGVQTANSAISVSKDCSRKCESEFCAVPPLLRYGKYCGLLYSGCPGERPCDGLDACCMKHDACVQSKNNDYLSQECSQNFLNCMTNFQKTGGHSFKGNTCSVNEVIDVITAVMDAALLAGRVLHKP